MFRRITFLTVTALLFAFAVSGNINAQESTPVIHPYLQVKLLTAAADEYISVYATLRTQFPISDLNNSVQFLTKKERQREVVRILKEYTSIQQENVLNYLEDAQLQSLVKNIHVLWVANSIVFDATPAAIYSLVENFNEIKEIRYSAEYDESQLIDVGVLNEVPAINPGDDRVPPPPQQGLILINAPAVWAEGDSGAGILVANLDDGCDWDHPDLVHNIWNNLGEDVNGNNATLIYNGSSWTFDPGDVNGIDDDNNGYVDDFIGWDFTGNDNDPYNPSSTHGTHTTGIVCGDGTNGTQTGVAPGAHIIILRPSGEAQYWLAQQYGLDKGIDIITSSLSYKWYFSPQPNYPMFRQVTDVELAAGVVHTNSTSNDGTNLGSAPIPYNISAPGNCPTAWIHPDQTLIGGLSSVIGCGNVDAFSDVIASSSPHGPSTWEDIQSIHPSYPYPMPINYQDYPYETQVGQIGLIKPDVSAPGSNTTSTTNGGGYSGFGGTSGATPHVAGTSALILAINPNLLPTDVSRILQLTSVEKGPAGKDNRYGAGRIDAYQAYLQALSEIPVELTSFTADAGVGEVVLKWKTATETNNFGFELEKSEGSEFKKIAFIPGHGTTTEEQAYIHTDETVGTGTYSYRLKQVDYDGSFKYSEVVDVIINNPGEFYLGQNYPNPFNPTTTISYSIPRDGLVTLKVYDVLGNEVKTLINEFHVAGSSEISFDASTLSSGVYYYQMISGEFTSIKKFILMK